MENNNQEFTENAESAVVLAGSMNVMLTDKFNDGYFDLHSLLFKNGNKISSRNGETLELLDFKTIVNNPLARCVGGKGRNINVFFLLAEAIWIWAGRRDVKFLQIFNQQIAEYSDDGKVFHAPYGWRLRHHGVPSEIVLKDDNKHSADEGIDQIAVAIEMLANNDEDRRVVMQIWNAEFDLNAKSKDVPCNDLVMLKIRDGKLNMTIANRSNDLDWGLCTNVFQFSFILEIMANILQIPVGTQTHNSNSLHLYDWNKLTKSIEDSAETASLYDNANTPLMDFDWEGTESCQDGLNRVDFFMKSIISNLLLAIDGNKSSDERFKDSLYNFSEFFYLVYCILEIYINYKNKVISRLEAMQMLFNLNLNKAGYKSDYLILALNFFVVRFESAKEPTDKEEITNLIQKIRLEIDANIGKY